MALRHTALLVEDDLATAAQLGDLLDSLGHDHLHVETQADAQAIIESRNDFCYVLLDLQIKTNRRSIEPRVEAGLGVLEFIRQKCPRRNAQDHRHLQVLVMSGHAKDTPWVIKAMQNGGDDFVVKPFSENHLSLADKIHEALRRSGRDLHLHCDDRTKDSRATSGAPGAATLVVPAKPAGFCRAVQNGREERWIDEAEYAALVADAKSFHLYLNLMNSPKERNREGGRRDKKSKFRWVDIPTVPAIAVAEVMRARNGLRVSDFNLQSTRVLQSIGEGRRKLDLQFPSGEWRALKTLTSDVRSETRFLLSPDEKVRYLLLHDLPGDGQPKSTE